MFGVHRVDGMAVSRSIGDAHVKSAVISEPEVKHFVLGPGDEFIVLASDGLWDVFSSQDAVDFVQANIELRSTPEMLARALVTLAYNLGSQDNITCRILFFGAGRSAGHSEL
eukprot:c16561_g1_i1.p1 GENE.c16561_g1_i1~~c16561_g1_i1.p1  ORF type:complete len:112 (+),score=28.03 c16561_g1_i1:548-883(+)